MIKLNKRDVILGSAALAALGFGATSSVGAGSDGPQ